MFRLDSETQHMLKPQKGPSMFASDFNQLKQLLTDSIILEVDGKFELEIDFAVSIILEFLPEDNVSFHSQWVCNQFFAEVEAKFFTQEYSELVNMILYCDTTPSNIFNVTLLKVMKSPQEWSNITQQNYNKLLCYVFVSPISMLYYFLTARIALCIKLLILIPFLSDRCRASIIYILPMFLAYLVCSTISLLVRIAVWPISIAIFLVFYATRSRGKLVYNYFCVDLLRRMEYSTVTFLTCCTRDGRSRYCNQSYYDRLRRKLFDPPLLYDRTCLHILNPNLRYQIQNQEEVEQPIVPPDFTFRRAMW